MNKLLTLAYANYQETSDKYFEIVAHDADELVLYVNEANYLYDNDFITDVSDNVFNSTIYISDFDIVISFTLTDKAVIHCQKEMG
jgi:hypothetical protein